MIDSNLYLPYLKYVLEDKIGILFKSVRINQGIKQQDIANAAGISHVALCRFEAGLSRLSLETLLKIVPLLNMNPNFLSDTALNPFSSSRLIKMFLSVEFLEIKYSMLSLFHVMMHTKITQVVFLIPPVTIFDKVVNMNITREVPVYAIICKDSSNNIFLFRRKNKTDFILKRQALEKALSRMVTILANTNMSSQKFICKTKKISRLTYDLIKNWTVELDDILPYMADEDKALRILQFAHSIEADRKDIQKVLHLYGDSDGLIPD